MSTRAAWILDLGGKHRAAVGERELLHLIHEPETFEVPLTPAHCRQVLFWRDQALAAVNLELWFTPGQRQAARRFAAILGYQTQRREPPRFGALLLAASPRRIEVDDRHACALPAQAWREVALACFDDGVGPIPILDLNRVFSGKRANLEQRAAA